MKIERFLYAIFPSLRSQAEVEEAYLAAAVDTHDLELRLREIDQRGRRMTMPLDAGTVTR